MAAIWMRLRSELRARWRSLLVLTLVVGVTGGVVLAAVAGARRTDSAYPRLIAWAHPADSGLFLSGGFGQSPVDPSAVRALPADFDPVAWGGVALARRHAGSGSTPLRGGGTAEEVVARTPLS